MKTPEELRKEFWDTDILSGGGVHSQYCEIQTVLDQPRPEWIERKLTELKKHAIKNVPFYAHYSVDDEFPVMNKSLLLDNYEAHKAIAGFDEPTHISSTSGSTGTPFSVIQDKKKRQRTIADLKVYQELCDCPSHERMIYFRGTTKNRTKEQEEKENIFYIDCGRLDDERLAEMFQSIIALKPRTVFANVCTLREMCRYAKEKNATYVFDGLVSIRTGGEACPEHIRKEVERIFGCTVYRRYSDMELGVLAQDTGNGSPYQLNWGSFYFECLKLDSDEPASEGEVGRIVVTDLFNYAFPMIRYDTGDLGIMHHVENEYPVLEEIYGRSRDCVYDTKGRMINPAVIEIAMWGNGTVKQMQFIQNDKNQYLIKVNPKSSLQEDTIIGIYKGILGNDAKISIEFVDEIPVLASNKRRDTVCNYVPQ